MFWTSQRPQPPGEGAVPYRLWMALQSKLNDRERPEFEAERERAKARLAKALDELDAMPEGEARRDRKWRLSVWCDEVEEEHFLRWAARVKFDWKRWLEAQAERVAL